MAEKGKKVKKTVGRAEYVSVRGLLKPGTAIMCIILMILMALATISIVIAVNNTTSGKIVSGDSILGNDNYIIGNIVTEDAKDLSTLSGQLTEFKSTDVEWTNIEEDPSQKGFFCISTEKRDDKLDVYNIYQDNICQKGYTLKDFNYIWVDSVDSSFYAVVNIYGEVVDLSNYYILVHDDSGNLASRLIINCPEAKVVNLTNAIVTGTLIAPNANIQYNSTSVYGQVYASSYTGVRAFYKEISFGGYAQLSANARSVYFENAVIRGIVVKWLKANYKETYGSYSDDYNPCGNDLSLVKSLVLDNQLIVSFGDDLKYFTSLESLSVKMTKLTSLDVSMLPNLQKLDISGTDITSLKFAENNKISSLICENTRLKTLDLANLPNLTDLSLKGTKFSSAPDYSKPSRLMRLDISDTNFTGFGDMDVSNLSSLLYLYASDNEKLKAMDLSKFKNLYFADLSSTSVEELNFDGLLNIMTMKLNYTKLSSIDVSGLKTLMQLDAFGAYDNITALDKTKVNVFATTPVTVVTTEVE